MIEIRRYLPLIAFVVPTVVIGYGFVIPRSCIAGVNELTVGFGVTIFASVLTYLAGQRVVLQQAARAEAPLEAPQHDD
jgi:ABC-type Fe3+ transport system permease subunit